MEADRADRKYDGNVENFAFDFQHPLHFLVDDVHTCGTLCSGILCRCSRQVGKGGVGWRVIDTRVVSDKVEEVAVHVVLPQEVVDAEVEQMLIHFAFQI